ncbi:MAG: DMT family transporter [Rhizobiales bacterium]|nr:DMT family transporter [Hyphomicrobiales bacterium]
MNKISLISKFESLPNNLKGAVVLTLAAGLFSASVLVIKMLGQTIHVTQILLCRQTVMTAMVLPAVLKGFPGILTTKTPWLQVLRIILAIGAMMFGFTAFIELPLAESTALGFAKSFFVSIFAIIILKEAVGPRRWAAVVAGFIGVIIMLQPGTDSFSIYSIYAVAGAGCAGLVMVIIRLMSRTENPKTILAWQAIGVGLIMIVPGIWFWVDPTPIQWGLIVVMGILSYGAQMLNILAYKFGEASLMASLDYVRLLYATVLGYMFFGDVPSGATWIGAAIIVASAIYTVWREAKRKQVLTRTHEGRIL